MVKRIVSAVFAIIIGVFMVTQFDHDNECVFYGFFIQFLTWDYIFKSWVKRLSKMFADDEERKKKNSKYTNNDMFENELDA